LIDLGSDLNWAEINPDIFGSMIQAVVHPDQRAGLGMHYTSVTNIMKVIEPLFLSEFKEEFVNAKGSKPKLKKLSERIGKIKIFDPACGSGNFLIIAYKELRQLEMTILKALGQIPMSGISLSNFYGIEIDDFAHEVAKLSLWLAEHQMDVLFNNEFGAIKASLPLKETGRIVCGNAARTDWNKVCPKTKDDEIYIPVRSNQDS
jgi:type II restriction/modification system DNA methylase subunit YeeA